MKRVSLLLAFIFPIVGFSQCTIDQSTISQFIVAFNCQYDISDSFKQIYQGGYCGTSSTKYYRYDDTKFDEKSQDEIFYDIAFMGKAKTENIQRILFSNKMDSIRAKKLTEYILCRFESSCIAELKELRNKRAKWYYENKKEGEIHLVVEEYPEFPGGMKQLFSFVENNLRYPSQAKNDKVEGKVFVEFIVDKKGKILSPKIVKGLGHGCDEEVIRLINQMPDWKPGLHYDDSVSVRYCIPISFKLNK